MIKHSSIAPTNLRSLIRSGVLRYAGNQRLKIYGTLYCTSGKRMSRHNRVFFTDEAEAIQSNYRPCGHCLKQKYLSWNRKGLLVKNTGKGRKTRELGSR